MLAQAGMADDAMGAAFCVAPACRRTPKIRFTRDNGVNRIKPESDRKAGPGHGCPEPLAINR